MASTFGLPSHPGPCNLRKQFCMCDRPSQKLSPAELDKLMYSLTHTRPENLQAAARRLSRPARDQVRRALSLCVRCDGKAYGECPTDLRPICDECHVDSGYCSAECVGRDMLMDSSDDHYDWSCLSAAFLAPVDEYACMCCLIRGDRRPSRVPKEIGFRRRNFICMSCWCTPIPDTLTTAVLSADELYPHTKHTIGAAVDTLFVKLGRTTREAQRAEEQKCNAEAARLRSEADTIKTSLTAVLAMARLDRAF